MVLATKVSLGKKIKVAGRKGKGAAPKKQKVCDGSKGRRKKAEKETKKTKKQGESENDENSNYGTYKYSCILLITYVHNIINLHTSTRMYAYLYMYYAHILLHL